MVKEVTRALFAGSVVYIAMAACSGSDATRSTEASGIDIEGAGGTRERATLGSGGQGAPGILDPVPDARAEDSAPVSGSRLRARWLVADDGSKQPAGWLDTKRNEECTFMRASDGLMRCLPRGLMVSAVYFGEATCITRVALLANSTCPANKYVLTMAASDCGEAKYIVRPGGQIVKNQGVWQKGADGKCAPVVSGAVSVHVLGEEIPASEFVAARAE